jgi:hypothetical protein
MVTAGANQAFTNLVLTLLDASDKVVLFKPYYFNHLMALQMTGGAGNVLFGEVRCGAVMMDGNGSCGLFSSVSEPGGLAAAHWSTVGVTIGTVSCAASFGCCKLAQHRIWSW